MPSTQTCVILVPAGGAIDVGCEEGLRELERRGYPVWRVRGYSAVDAARCQMATDALAAGFEELFWIDSDIVFNADDVEKLRRHQLPFVCAIYPKKGPRQFAANYLPGTSSLLFGKAGGVTEILYSGFGFNCTHRSVYEDIQKQLKLPICNERFPKPLVPFFMPFVHDDGGGPWYLSEDYAFCARARQCGHRIMVDTTVRLWHVGSYRYSWEDAGSDKKRFDNYNFAITQTTNPPSSGEKPASVAGVDVAGPSNSTAPSLAQRLPFTEEILVHPGASCDAPLTPLQSPESANAQHLGLNPDVQCESSPNNTSPTSPGLSALRAEHPWPAERPSVIPNRNHGWLQTSTKDLLARHLSDETRLVVELGSWLGLSTRFILKTARNSAVIAVDHWQGSPEHHTQPEAARLLPRLFETFQVNCWDSRDRLLPLRMSSIEGLKLIAANDLRPDLIFIDADHNYEPVKADLETCLNLFPMATLVGDDWNWAGVRQAVEDVCRARNIEVQVNGVGWTITRA